MKAGNKCYWFSTNTQPWLTSSKTCQYKGGELAISASIATLGHINSLRYKWGMGYFVSKELVACPCLGWPPLVQKTQAFHPIPHHTVENLCHCSRGNNSRNLTHKYLPDHVYLAQYSGQNTVKEWFEQKLNPVFEFGILENSCMDFLFGQ